MVQVTELWQWWHHCYLLVIWWGMKLYFTVVGQAMWGDEYQLVTECTHGDFIVLPYWYTRPLTPWPTIPLSRIILRLSQPVLIMPSAKRGSDKYQFKSHWFDSTRVRKLRGLDSNLRPSDSPISQNSRQMLYSFGHPNWLIITKYCLRIYRRSSTAREHQTRVAAYKLHHYLSWISKDPDLAKRFDLT